MMKELVTSAILGLGCGQADTAEPVEVSPAAEAQQWVQEGVLLVDVRTPGEFASGHVEGALNIPVGQLGDRLDEVQGDRVVVYCHSGGRSARAARLLTQRGKQVVDLGAMSSWPDQNQIVH